MKKKRKASSASRSKSTSASSTRAPAHSRGSVLILENDASFRKIVADFLVGSGYFVVAVGDGAEGIRKIVAQDFTVILCDLMMPKLPGEKFYHAAGRVRPTCLDRFVFMTGDLQNKKTGEFIQHIDACVLRKPFPLDLLPDTIALVELRAGLGSQNNRALENPAPAIGVKSSATEQDESSSSIASEPASEPRPSAKGGEVEKPFRIVRMAGILLLVAIFGIAPWLLGGWYFHNRQRDLVSELERLKTEAVPLQIELDEADGLVAKAESDRAQIEAARDSTQPARDLAAKPGWAPALEALAEVTASDIAMLGILGRGTAKGCEMSVEASVTGKNSWTRAERFRNALQSALEVRLGGVVTIQFDKQRQQNSTGRNTRFVAAATVERP